MLGRSVIISVLLSLFTVLIARPVNAGTTAQSEHFILMSDTPVAADAILRDLEHLRSAVLIDLGLPVSDEAEPLILTITDDTALFDQVSPGAQTAAIYLRSAIGNDIVVGHSHDRDHLLHDALDPEWLRLVLRHEVTHHIIEQHYPRKLPIWLGEGLAEYYATFRLEPDGDVSFGKPFPEQDHLSHTAPWLPMRTVVESMNTYPDYRARDRDSLFRSQRLYYGQAWALAHFVMDQPQGLATIHRFVDDWPQHGDSEASFEQTFGLDYDALETVMRNRVETGSAKDRRIKGIAGTERDIEVSTPSSKQLRQNALRLLIQYGHLRPATDQLIERYESNISQSDDRLTLAKALRAWRYRDWDRADTLSQTLMAQDAPPIVQAKAMTIRAKAAYGRVSEFQMDKALWTQAETIVDEALYLSPDDASLHLFRVAVTLPDVDGLPDRAKTSLAWLLDRNIRRSKPHEAMMMVPALIYEQEFDRADAVLNSAARWTLDRSDHAVIDRLRRNVAMERDIRDADRRP